VNMACLPQAQTPSLLKVHVAFLFQCRRLKKLLNAKYFTGFAKKAALKNNLT